MYAQHSQPYWNRTSIVYVFFPFLWLSTTDLAVRCTLYVSVSSAFSLDHVHLRSTSRCMVIATLCLRLPSIHFVFLLIAILRRRSWCYYVRLIFVVFVPPFVRHSGDRLVVTSDSFAPIRWSDRCDSGFSNVTTHFFSVFHCWFVGCDTKTISWLSDRCYHLTFRL